MLYIVLLSYYKLSEFLGVNRNSSIKYAIFKSCLAIVHATPPFKENKEVLKKTYRHIRILPTFSKIIERSNFR